MEDPSQKQPAQQPKPQKTSLIHYDDLADKFLLKIKVTSSTPLICFFCVLKSIENRVPSLII